MLIKSIPYLFLKSRKRVVRTFDLEVALTSPHNIWFEEVMNSIEKKNLLVFDPMDRDGLAVVLNDTNNIVVNAGAKESVKIIDWLPVACQTIEFLRSSEFDEDTLACYRNNIVSALFKPGVTIQDVHHGTPPGPATFVGKIQLNSKIRSKPKEVFKWIVAHELVHSFDALRFLVPASKNWNAFWVKLLGGGQYARDAMDMFGWQRDFLDQEYGSPSELASIKEYWPSQADEWFRASHATES